MRPGLFAHRVVAKRQTQTVTNGLPVTSVTTIVSSLRCLVEGLEGAARDSLMGRVDGARYTISWPPAQVQNGAAITYTGRDGDLIDYNGRQYYLRDILDDTTRGRGGYLRAILAERNR